MEGNKINGDLYLIRKIKENPVIWNTQHSSYHNRQQRDNVFQELSNATNLEVGFIKRRWTTIRERYVRELRGELLHNRKATYKYMEDLSYLRNFVKMKHTTDRPDENHVLNHTGNDSESVEFEITEEDLLENSEHSSEIVFEEFHDENVNKKRIIDKSDDMIEVSDNQRKSTEVFSDAPTQVYYKRETQDNSIPSNQTTTTDSGSAVTEPNNLFFVQNNSAQRHEDTIFGELITSQLIKITDEHKKQEIKRKILALFF